MSSQFSAGVRAITLVKLTFSLAAVSAATAARMATRVGRRSDDAAATPTIAPMRVRAAVAQHGPLGEVVGQQRGGRASGRRDLGARAWPVQAEREAAQQRYLGRPARAQIEQVEQVRAPRHQTGVDGHISGSAER